MKKTITTLWLAGMFACVTARTAYTDIIPENTFQETFKKAYSVFPSIPEGVLEAVAFTQTRFQNLEKASEPSCIGYPKAYGVMGLIEDGKNYFRNNLSYVAKLSGYTERELLSNAETGIMAYAAAFSKLQSDYKLNARSDLKSYKPLLIALSELPLSTDPENDFAINAHLYQIYYFLSVPEFQVAYHFKNHRVNLSDIFGPENLKVLSASKVYITETNIEGNNGATYKVTNAAASVASADYGPAIWNPTTCNFSSRAGTAITAIAIHDVEGTYAGCISWFKNCTANASAHYVIRSSDGQITQMVLEADKAWHIGSENPYTLGIEHEGYSNNAAWYTNAMYSASALLVKDMCTSHSINSLRTFYGPGCSGSSTQCGIGACTKVKGHQMYPNQTHTDPGPNWNWDKYYRLINSTYTGINYTSASGTFYDSGGSAGNYNNDERKIYRFTRPGATSIKLNFTQFSLESGYDYMFIHNGGKTMSPVVGKYSGTTSPGVLTISNDTVLIDFRSDCATVMAGWAANYTITVPPAMGGSGNATSYTGTARMSAGNKNGLLAAEAEVFPNPFSNSFNLSLYIPENTPVTLSLRDALGREVMQERMDAEAGWLSKEVSFTQELKSGIYWLQIKTGENSMYKKVIKE